MLLKCNNISAFYHNRQVLEDVCLQVDAGEIVCLLGGNASGKSTTLKAILGLVDVKRGRITLDGSDITGLSTAEIVHRGVAIVPENRRLFPSMTIEENLLLALQQRDLGQPLGDALAPLLKLLPLLSDRARFSQLAGTLSGGEQQQVAIARAILLRPRLLLLDEPSMGLSPLYTEQSFSIIRSLAEQGVGIFLVEQNVKTALKLSSRGYVLQEGRIVQQGLSADLLVSERIHRAFLGEFV